MSGGGIQNARLGKANIWKTDDALGTCGKFQDKDHSDPDAVQPFSGRSIVALYVKNSASGELAPATGVTMKSGEPNEVGAASGANAICDGVIDPFLSANVAVGDYFWLIVEGPCDVEIGAGDITANAVCQTIAAGKFATGTAGTNPIGHCGKAEEAAVSGARARVIFGNPFSIAKLGCC